MSRPPPASASGIAALRARYGERYKWYALAIVMIGTVAAVLSTTIVNVALPGIAAFFEIGHERVQWVSSANMAAMTVAMLVLPWALVRYGFRRVFFAAMVLLFTGSLAGALAAHFGLLLAARVIVGCAAGLLQPMTTVLILRAFPPEQRGRAMGVFGFGVVLAPAIGPSVGGLLVDWFDWRAVFFVPLPFAVLAALLAARLLPVMEAPPERKPFDTLGFLMLAVFVVSLLEGLVRLHDHGIGSPMMIGWFSATVLLAVALWTWERRNASPLIDLQVFESAGFTAGFVVAVIYGMGLFGSTLLIPLFVQEALHYTPSRSGMLLMPAGLALAFTIPLAGRLTDRYPPRRLVIAGLVLFSASFMLLALIPDAGFVALAAMLVVGRIGLGVILPSLSLGTIQSVDPARVASASSLYNFGRLLGGSIGTGALAVFVEWRVGSLAAGFPRNADPVAALQPYQDGFSLLAVVFVLAALAATRISGQPRLG
ncbi:MAG TPA: DHA2 family efflux MFS transporter permease subunit [Burkholderiaceae bacterium]|nr:DHA2 family efflux MFS transporter permease subunit [Burkholderiaceae bacterium]